MKQVQIAIVGLGVVGSQIYQQLTQKKELLTRRLGFSIEVAKVCELNQERLQKLNIPQEKVATIDEVINDSQISIVVEMIGDKPIAKELMLKALNAKKHVVSANKAILAKHGLELFHAADQNDVEILFEAAVGGAIPILRTLREGFVAESLSHIRAIINGTANYILSEMEKAPIDFDVVLKQAQQKGYAEADPTSDIEGDDTLSKLIILCALATGHFLCWDQIYKEGITQISAFDFKMADKLGFAIKLLAIYHKRNQGLDARVHPALVAKDHILADVKGAFNAVMVTGNDLGDALLYGLGAGGAPTATAVIADIVEASRNIVGQSQGVAPLGYPTSQIKEGVPLAIDEISFRYYLRFELDNKSGVIAKITEALADQQINIQSLHQDGEKNDSSVFLVLLTDQTPEHKMKKASEELKTFAEIKNQFLIRVEENAVV